MSEYTTKQEPEGFSVDWLSLRESADHRARSKKLTQKLTDWSKQIPRLNVIELGAGTGSNLRYLCPLLGHKQHWTLFDNDLTLLQSIDSLLVDWAVKHSAQVERVDDTLHISSQHFSAHVQWQHCDLASHLQGLPFNEAQLVTGAALLDLTSARWLEQLATNCIKHGCASLFTLNYNGTVNWRKSIAEDAQVTSLLNLHQLKEKGFGPALGPDAHAFYRQSLIGQQQVFTDDSDWVLGNEDLDLQQALINGWAPAAIEQGPDASLMIEQWKELRGAAVSQRSSALRVGHTDVMGLPVG